MQRFNINEAPPMPQKASLRAEPRHPGRDERAVPQGSPVRATGEGLIRSTLKALAAAAAILVLFVLPGEYGIDPTGVGRLLGLTEMGEIKQQLTSEAAADDAAAAAAAPAAAVAPASSGDAQIGPRLDAIERQLSELSAGLAANPSARPRTAAVSAEPVAPSGEAIPAAATSAPVPPARAADSAAPPAATWRDEATVTLPPGEGIELKLAMEKGQIARFEWSANGAVLNHDTHGDGGGEKITYAQGRGVSGEVGELTAAFTGNHGWFWRNRSDEPVTLSLRVGGEYSRFIRP